MSSPSNGLTHAHTHIGEYHENITPTHMDMLHVDRQMCTHKHMQAH